MLHLFTGRDTSGGYIMRMRPIAIGMEVVPTLMRSKLAFTSGKIAPIAIPTAIARKIHNVR